MQGHSRVIIGGGPAGLAAAYELARRGARPLVLEKADKVGGISRTEVYKGYRFDVGGHRFFSRNQEVRRLWRELLGGHLLKVPRLSRIHYDGRFFNYPLDLFNTVGNLGVVESSLILMSYLRARLWPQRQEETFEQWVTNRFGARLFRTFFQSYTEKVWGMPCTSIQADWAAQRIGGMSVSAAIRSALFGANGARTLVNEFHYPVLGPGMMWEGFQREVSSLGGRVRLDSEVIGVNHHGGRVGSILVREAGGGVEVEADHVISSMPVIDLIARLNPPPPEDVIRAASALKYRAFILVALIVDREDVFPDNWVYVHAPAVKAARIQNFKNWSPAMVADPAKTSLGVEYFCDEGDDTWRTSDGAMLDLAAREMAALGLLAAGEVEDGAVIRQRKAYPVYDRGYRENLLLIRGFLGTFHNLQSVGRNGMHRYNNQDHSMLTGMLAARNSLGEAHDVWTVNGDQSYGESLAAGAEARPPRP